MIIVYIIIVFVYHFSLLFRCDLKGINRQSLFISHQLIRKFDVFQSIF